MEECQLQQGLCGFYYEPKHLIVIDETMLDFQKRCTLCHELVHAHNHDQGCSPYGSKAERRARLYTALRHTAASLAVHAGANVKALQRMLGHKNASMTLDVYADLFDSDLMDVARLLDAAVQVETGVEECGQNVGKNVLKPV